MAKKQSFEQHREQKALFCSVRSMRTLCRLLHTDQRKLELLIAQPQYRMFKIPKKSGGFREIETPRMELKKVLTHLNRYLQSVYLFELSHAAYGFIVGVRSDDDRRSIVSNAKRHVGRSYLLQVDLKNFFHAVTREKVIDIFDGPPFHFKRDLPNILADLVTHQGRLPMGTSTSPVLSNFACRELDAAVTDMSKAMFWEYTRYADDMVFSSNQPINAEKINSVRAIIRHHGFEVNERKLKVFGPEDKKIVTGLLINKRVELAPDYISTLQSDLDRLSDVLRLQNEQGQLTTRWVEQFKQQVRGRISFAGFVLKKQHETYLALRDAYYTAINPPEEEFGAINWRGFPYNL